MEKKDMEEPPHLITHFLVAGAEKRLEDYHFLRNTYETINGQEIQLNRILRMLGEDEFCLSWRTDLLPIGRSRVRAPYDFDRWSSTVTLQGNIAYERLRELEHDNSRSSRQPIVPSLPRRVHELRERRQRMSEQRELQTSTGSDGSSTSSSARLKALAEYDTAMAESEAKRKRQSEENRLSSSKDEENHLLEKRREKFQTLFNEKQIDNHLKDEQNKNIENNSNKFRRSSIEHDHDKTGDIELISFTVRCEPISTFDENNLSVRLFCKWASPSSSSAINYFTIERQFDGQEWLPVGEKIDKLDNQTQLDISSFNKDEINSNVPSFFRLKAHLQNGRTFTSKPTDGIFMNSLFDKKIIQPNVEILSANSVQLTWNDNQNQEKENIYDIEKKEEEQQSEWEKVTEVPVSQCQARIDNLTDAEQCQFRLIESSHQPEQITKTDENEVEPEVLTVSNVNELLNSLHIQAKSSTTVDIEISEDGFKDFNSYQIEYTTVDKLDQWKQVSNITDDNRNLTVDNLKQGTNYKFRFTPMSSDKSKVKKPNSSQMSLVLDVEMPLEPITKIENETPVHVQPQFSIQKIDSTSVLIEAVLPEEEPATFEDVYDVYSKNETFDDDWTKVGTIDKEHLNTTVDNLKEDSHYAFKIDNTTTPSDDDEHNTIQEFKFETTKPIKQYDPSLFLAKIEKSLENVVAGVMQAASGHQILDEPVNKSLNEVIKEVFRDETLVPNEEYGFDTLALTNDLQLYRGPKQMMIKELEANDTVNSSQNYGEIIIHNYNSSEKSVLVREENGNTRVANIDGDVIIRNVVSDVIFINERIHHQLSMNIVGQAFLKAVQGTLIASKFKGIIVVKNVNKP